MNTYYYKVLDEQGNVKYIFTSNLIFPENQAIQIEAKEWDELNKLIAQEALLEKSKYLQTLNQVKKKPPQIETVPTDQPIVVNEEDLNEEENFDEENK